MMANSDDWYDQTIRSFLAQVSDTAADEPPGAIGVVCLAAAAAASLLQKCTDDDEAVKSLRAIASEFLSIAMLDGAAYNNWKYGDEDSLAIEEYPGRVASLSANLVSIATAMPTNLLTGRTDIACAGSLASGCAHAAQVVIEGNAGRL